MDDLRGSSEAQDLPVGWARARIVEFTTKVGSGATPRGGSESYKTSGIPLIRSQNVHLDGFHDEGLAYIDEQQAEALDDVLVHANDVLLNITGASIGRVTLAPNRMQGARVNQHVCIVRPVQGVLPQYLASYLANPGMQGMIMAEEYGVTRQALTKGQILGFEIPLAPLAEQSRIVAKVEALFERVNLARARLARLPATLERFRQSALGAARSGQLTADWREGRDGTEGDWREMSLKELLSEALANGRSVPDAKDGFPVLRLTCLKNGRIDLSERKIGAWTADAAKRFLVHKGDFFVSRGNGSLALVGRGGLVQDEPDAVAYPDTLIRVRVQHELIAPEFLSHLWNAKPVRDQIESAAHTTAGIWKISQSDLEGFRLPVPPLTEQHEIVHRVEALFALADKIEAHVRTATVRAERLPQAILARAFRGELVPSEADLAAREGRDYEPASVLLERIQEARKQYKPAKRGRGGKKMAKRSTGRQAAGNRRPLDAVLREQGKPLTPERLLDLAGFDESSVDGFYEQLRKLIQNGRIRENRPNKKDVTLEALGT